MKPLLMTKVKNAFKKVGNDPFQYQFYLKNININGDKRGCSGFIINRDTKSCVYVNTEPSVLSSMQPYLYRYADDNSDYKGYRNRYASSLDELVKNIVDLTAKTPQEWQRTEFRL